MSVVVETGAGTWVYLSPDNIDNKITTGLAITVTAIIVTLVIVVIGG